MEIKIEKVGVVIDFNNVNIRMEARTTTSLFYYVDNNIASKGYTTITGSVADYILAEFKKTDTHKRCLERIEAFYNKD